jgi:hypothetical protein
MLVMPLGGCAPIGAAASDGDQPTPSASASCARDSTPVSVADQPTFSIERD